MTEPATPDNATARQRLAADPSHSAWVSANAGTGKTRVLTDRIARLLLRHVRPERILCLTYTKAAAAEMQNRINSRLGEWATLGDEALAGELLKLTGRPADVDDLTRARRLFADTLEAPGGVNVRTIHAFCESLLARFPVEAGVAPHARIMDEREARALQHDAQRAVFRRIEMADGVDHEDLGRALAFLAGHLQADGFMGLVEALLRDREKLADALAAYGGIPGLVDAVHAALGISPRETADTVMTAACADDAFDGGGLREAVAVYRHGNKTEQACAITFEAWLAADQRTRLVELWPIYRSAFLTLSGAPRADSGVISKKTKEERPDIAAAVTAERARIADVEMALRAHRIAEGTAHLIRIGAALLDAYERLKSERAALDYDDLIYKALGLLASEDAAAWVHYKLDGGIDHILVDEAQDTSAEQWEIIERLSLEMFSGAGARDETPNIPSTPPARSIFAVGDEKQSIYSFQGADPAGFGRTRKRFRDRIGASGKGFQSVELIESFRSTKPVLDAVDAAFAREPARVGVAEPEHDVRHLASRHGHAGSIELWPAIARDAKDDANPWLPLDDARRSSPLAQTAKRVAEVIDRWISSGEVLPSLGRPMHAGDIMILLERRSQFAEEMVKQLKDRGIEVAGSDRMALADQISVMDLMAAMRTALLVDDDLTLATVLKGPFVGLGEDELFTLAHGRSGSLWRALETRAASGAPWASARDAIAALRTRADAMPPYEFLATLLGAGRGRRRLYARLGAEAGDPIDEFLGLALFFEREHPPSLQGFLHWVEQGATEIKRDMEAVERAVRVMTVHGAKGLEAPVVILPDTCGDSSKRHMPPVFWHRPTDSATALPLWPANKDNWTDLIERLGGEAETARSAENHRLLYVAMTRARDRLHVTGWERAKRAKNAEHGRKPGSWYELVRPAIEDLPGSEPFEAPGGAGIRLTSPQLADPGPERDAVAVRAAARDAEPWMTSKPPDETDPPEPLTPSRFDENEPAALSPFAGGDTARFRRGRIIHRLLQSLPDVDPTTWKQTASRWLERSAPDLSGNEREAICGETLAVLADPAFAPLFAAGSYAEVPIAGLVETADGKRAIAGQVDRLAVTANEVVVIDYKTNRPPPASESDVAPAYLRQMAAYRAALRAIYPDRAVRCVLLWTDGPRAMPLADETLDTYAP